MGITNENRVLATTGLAGLGKQHELSIFGDG